MRTPMITRTMETMTVTVMAVEVESSEVINKTYELGRVVKDADKLEKVMRKLVEKEAGIKFVTVVDTKTETTIYGMSEDDFIKYAQKLDENRKVISADAE